MQDRTPLLSTRLSIAAVLLAMLCLGVSCGGSSTDDAPAVTGSVPTGGTTPDTTGDTPLPTGTTGDDIPDRGEDDATDDDGTPVPGDDDGVPPPPEPPLPARSWDGFLHVAALATNPIDGTVYAVGFETGTVYRRRPDDAAPQELGHWEPVPRLDPEADPEDPGDLLPFAFGPVRGLAWRSAGPRLLAVIDRGGSVPDDLIGIDPVTLEGKLIGPIGARTGVESLAWYENQQMIYGVDRTTRELIAIDPATGDVVGSRVLRAEFGDVDGLAVDDEGRCLYGSDATRGVIYRFATLDVGPVHPPADDPGIPTVQRMGKTVDGKMQGLAFVPGEKLFYGVDPELGRLFLSDPMGNEIHATALLGMAYCAEDGLLYASHVGNQKLVGINTDSLWKHYVGATDVPMLEGLADGGPGAHYLYGISSMTQEIYRIDRMTAATVPIARLHGPGSPWTGLKSLAFRANRLYAVDAITGDLLRIDPMTGVAEQVGMLVHGGIQSLAYQAEGDLLHAYSNDARMHLMLRGLAPGAVEEAIPNPYSLIGALGWDAVGERLFGSDLAEDRLTVIYETPKPASMPYAAVHAIVWNHDTRLLGADIDTTILFEIDVETQGTAEIAHLGDANIEAMAAHHPTGRVYMSDTSGPYLLVMEPDLTMHYVGFPGPPVVLATDGIKALTWDPLNEVLYGVDLNGAGGATLVTIDPATGSITAFPRPLGFDSVEALSWDPLGWNPDSVRLVAVDRETRTLLQIHIVAGDPEAGVGIPIGAQLPEELSDVRGAALAPHSLGALEVVDATQRRVYTVDSFTGEILR